MALLWDAQTTGNLPKMLLFMIVPMVSGGYDKGGAYWGLSSAQLRVRYTKDLSYAEFYWSENNGWIVIQRGRKLGAKNYRTDKFISPLYATFSELQDAFLTHA